MEDIAVEIKNTEKRIAEKEVELSAMQAELKQLIVLLEKESLSPAGLGLLQSEQFHHLNENP